MAEVVVVKFKKGCKSYYFGKGSLTLSKGQGVIVETAKGLEYAVVVDPAREVEEASIVQPLKNVVRIATERDEEAIAAGEARRAEAMRICKEKIAAHELPMKLIDCEFSFDGSKVVFSFTSEGRVDFRDLVRDLASVFHIRIELRQVGIRDEARILGGIAPCGREVCCAGCMPEFKKVSIKMAKNQGLSLNPGKISGLCGRLMCCLAYEDDFYAAACKQVPKVGSFVSTPEGKGQVVSVNVLKMELRVKIENEGALIYRDFAVDSVTRAEPGRAEPEEKDEREEQVEAEEKKNVSSARNERNAHEKRPAPKPREEHTSEKKVHENVDGKRARDLPEGKKQEKSGQFDAKQGKNGRFDAKKAQQGNFRARRNHAKGGSNSPSPDKKS